ncbi:pentapeptide repeat-containing protein [Paracoccus luteus]|uniref:pentapeptide repeat-containing protein n=1 Tax=Paracoccus luteus TaxID=2508543 RepID=UPI0010704092|nr:pentapeptide repeat-containing protein [Paracoccus luteus]
MRGAEIRARLEVPYRFGEHVDLRRVVCEDHLDLDGATLTAADFTGARFPQGISACGARFQGLAWFCGVHAAGGDLSGAVFHSDARFDGAQFTRRLVMQQAEFRGVLQFDGATLAEGVDLSDAVGYGNCSFERARLQGASSLRGSEWMGGLWMESAILDRLETDDMQVHGRLWTRRARLGDAALPPARFSISFGYAYA